MDRLGGIGSNTREKLSKLIRIGRGAFSIQQASQALNLSLHETARLLSRLTKQGWLSRLKRGQYIPIPVESLSTKPAIEDPWILAASLFPPCFIGGWSAVEHWEFTEQIYKSTFVVTTKKVKNRHITINGAEFAIRTTKNERFFGYASVWRSNVKVNISDPHRTIIDLLDSPEIGGGIRPVLDIFKEYLKSNHRNVKQLITYATQLKSGVVFKRLGYLLENLRPQETTAIKTCKDNLTQGNSKIDPALKADRLITKWKLWVPESILSEFRHD